MQARLPRFVAVHSSAVVGWCDVWPSGGEPAVPSGQLGMGLLPQCRRKAIAGRLLTATLNAAQPMRLKRVELDVFDDNRHAIRLHEIVGFADLDLWRTHSNPS